MRTTTSRALATLSAAAILGLAAGCGGSSDDSSTTPATSSAAAPAASSATTEPATAGKAVNIAYLTYAGTDYVQAISDGATATVSGAGGSVKLFSADFDPQKQQQQCTDAITSQRYNAIIIEAVDGSAILPCVEAAKAAGIPVGAVEIVIGPDIDKADPQVPGVVASVVFPASSNANGMLDQTKAACEGIDPCKVIVEVASASDPFTNQVPKTLKDAGGNIDVVQVIPGQYDPATIQAAIGDALTAHPDANVFASAADSQALAVVDQVKTAGLDGKLKLLGNGFSRLGAKAIADGTMASTLGNYPYQMGQLVAQGLSESVNGQPVSKATVDATQIETPYVIDKSNVANFKAEWGAE